MKQNNGGPAFPQHGYESQDEKHWNSEECGGAGLTLRDYFAAKAMPLAMDDYKRRTLGIEEPVAAWDELYDLSCIAADAYRLADAMLAARDA